MFTAEAQLSPQPGRQLLLEFHPDRPDGRRNYSVCHEIIHTFFDDCYELVHQRRSNRTPLADLDEIESLCQIGASELLMPADDFSASLDAMAFSLESVTFRVVDSAPPVSPFNERTWRHEPKGRAYFRSAGREIEELNRGTLAHRSEVGS